MDHLNWKNLRYKGIFERVLSVRDGELVGRQATLIFVIIHHIIKVTNLSDLPISWLNVACIIVTKNG